jgi:transcriptional regulator with XRE-family HTH domain
MSQNNTLAERLTVARKENNYTQDEIAKLLHCGRATITNYENGRRSPDYDALVTLAKTYNVTTDYLLGITDSETTDKDIRYICDYTNLSTQAVECLHGSNGFARFLNYFLVKDIQKQANFLFFSTSFTQYKVAFTERLKFKKQLIENICNKQVYTNKFIIKTCEKDKELNNDVDLIEFNLHKKISELLNLYIEDEMQEDEKISNDYDVVICNIMNKKLELIENNLVKGGAENAND